MSIIIKTILWLKSHLAYKYNYNTPWKYYSNELAFSPDFSYDLNKAKKINHKMMELNCLHNSKSLINQVSTYSSKEHLSETLSNLDPKQYNTVSTS